MGQLYTWNAEGNHCVCQYCTPEGVDLGDYYLESVCPGCDVGTLLAHPEYEGWLKCVTCGYSRRESKKVLVESPNE